MCFLASNSKHQTSNHGYPFMKLYFCIYFFSKTSNNIICVVKKRENIFNFRTKLSEGDCYTVVWLYSHNAKAKCVNIYEKQKIATKKVRRIECWGQTLSQHRQFAIPPSSFFNGNKKWRKMSTIWRLWLRPSYGQWSMRWFLYFLLHTKVGVRLSMVIWSLFRPQI